MDGNGRVMIGIGIDIQSIDEFAASPNLQESGLCFTESERAHGESARAGVMASLAGIFAAKEALFKALPKRPLCYWDDLEVCHDSSGRPMFRFYGAMAQWMESVGWRAMPSISHSGTYVTAVAVVEQDK